MSISLSLPSLKYYAFLESFSGFSKKKLENIKKEEQLFLEKKTQKALIFLNRYKAKCLIASPCNGVGKTRTVILGDNHGRWRQVIKIWGNTRAEAFNYANTLLRLERWKSND